MNSAPEQNQTLLNQNLTFGGLLGLSELGIGSLLHGFKVPLSGQFLSLNQILILSLLARQAEPDQSRLEPFHASCQASLIKAFSPAGKRLTPMIAITAQGLLFSIGTLLFGFTTAGVLLGSIFAGVWSFVQPLLLMTLFFGERFWNGFLLVAKTLEKLTPIPEEWIIGAVILFIFSKIILSAVVALIGFYGSVQWTQKYRKLVLNRAEQMLIHRQAPKTSESIWRLALRDITRPFFIFGVLLTGTFIYFETSSAVDKVWILTRSIGVAYLGFVLLRHPKIEAWFIKKLSRAT